MVKFRYKFIEWKPTIVLNLVLFQGNQEVLITTIELFSGKMRGTIVLVGIVPIGVAIFILSCSNILISYIS